MAPSSPLSSTNTSYRSREDAGSSIEGNDIGPHGIGPASKLLSRSSRIA